MQKRLLGSTGINVSVIGLGTVKFGRNQGVKYPQSFDLPSDETIDELLNVAKECGINLIDTAPAYGLSEERLGRALVGQREQWVITTKVGETYEQGVSTFDFTPLTIKQSVERSLLRLRTDYVDIVLAHSNGDDIGIMQRDDVFATLTSLREEGKLRAFGMSTKTIAGGLQTIAQADVAMVAFHEGYTDEREIIAAAHAQHKGILIKKAFASGHQPSASGLAKILAEQGVSSVIIGTINAKHLRENVAWAGS